MAGLSEQAKRDREVLALNGLKRCGKCERTLTFEQFQTNRTKWDGFQSSCRECQNAARRGYERNRIGNRPADRPWRTDDIGYVAAHTRVHAVKGRASWHQCSAEGCDRVAQDWAYQFSAGDRELVEWLEDSRNGKTRELAYSPDPADYAPMCKGCHSSYDKRMAGERAGLMSA